MLYCTDLRSGYIKANYWRRDNIDSHSTIYSYPWWLGILISSDLDAYGLFLFRFRVYDLKLAYPRLTTNDPRDCNMNLMNPLLRGPPATTHIFPLKSASYQAALQPFKKLFSRRHLESSPRWMPSDSSISLFVDTFVARISYMILRAASTWRDPVPKRGNLCYLIFPSWSSCQGSLEYGPRPQIEWALNVFVYPRSRIGAHHHGSWDCSVCMKAWAVDTQEGVHCIHDCWRTLKLLRRMCNQLACRVHISWADWGWVDIIVVQSEYTTPGCILCLIRRGLPVSSHHLSYL